MALVGQGHKLDIIFFICSIMSFVDQGHRIIPFSTWFYTILISLVAIQIKGQPEL